MVLGIFKVSMGLSCFHTILTFYQGAHLSNLGFIVKFKDLSQLIVLVFQPKVLEV